MHDQLPPHSLDAERCAIASLMLAGDDQGLFCETQALLSRDAFFQSDHQTIYAVLCDLHDRGSKIDAVLLFEELTRRKLIGEVGGKGYLATLLNSVPAATHGPHYAKVVREKATLRGVINAAHEAIRQAYAATDHDRANDIVQEMMARLANLTASAASTEVAKLEDCVHAAMAQLERGETFLVKTGVAPLDNDLGGIAAGEMLVIGARPSMGKSTLARQIACSAAGLGIPVGFISLEEGREKIARNMLSAVAGVENNALRRGQIKAHEWTELAHGVAQLSRLPVYIADKAFRMPALRSVASMLVARYGVKILIIDYLQRIQIEGRDRYEKVTNISSELSALVKELNVAGIVLAQLNREVAKRPDKRPCLSDLRESGQIEQDADQILFLHREDYYRATGDADGAPDGVAELIKAKYRDGCRGGVIRLRSNLQYQRFEELQRGDPFQ